MVKIEAIIRPTHFDAVKDALEEIGFVQMTVTDARGYGHQRGYTHRFLGAEYKVNLLQKTKIEIVTLEADATPIITAIIGAAKTGEIGDGRIFVTPIISAIRIRTGEWGEDAV
jgi:nitrogen regulatory protein P-II 1